MKDKLLLHCCCAPCSTAILEHLKDHFDITLYFYNPCITDEKEYNARVKELNKLKNIADVNIIISEYDPQSFYDKVKGHENAKEGASRCSLCFQQRLLKTAEYAKNNGFEYFSTTLTISPYKDSRVINHIGKKCGWKNDVMYMPFDFGFLYVRSLELCEKYELYQQDYCGCEYSKKEEL